MTTLRKDIRNNWEARDHIKLAGEWELQITTIKTSDGSLVTRASVHQKDGNFVTHRMFHDFSQRLMTAKVRCTEKNVAEQHAGAMTKREEILEAIVAWYAAKGETVTA
jgi:hypothetical protein